MGGVAVLMLSAATRGQDYAIPWFTIDGGGHISSSGGAYTLGATIGQPDAGAVMSGGAYVLAGGFWPGAASSDACTGAERIKKASCKNRNGSNLLKVILVDGVPGDDFTIELTDGTQKSGTINNRGKGKGKFTNRPAGDAAKATATWGCGASDVKTYTCP
ncbi:MAG: hypothetical protein AMXMBFR22_21410 [Phycisphaerae bacterium]